MSAAVVQHKIKLSAGIRGARDEQPLEHLEIGRVLHTAGANAVRCQHCNKVICDALVGRQALALVHRGVDLRGRSFEKAYCAWPIIGGQLGDTGEEPPGEEE